jgi:hypothetical protein
VVNLLVFVHLSAPKENGPRQRHEPDFVAKE